MGHDTNLAIIVGTLVSTPDIRSRRAILTLATKTPGPPRRIDVLPVVWSDPPDDVAHWTSGARVEVVGAIRRRFWATEHGRESRLEIHVGTVSLREP